MHFFSSFFFLGFAVGSVCNTFFLARIVKFLLDSDLLSLVCHCKIGSNTPKMPALRCLYESSSGMLLGGSCIQYQNLVRASLDGPSLMILLDSLRDPGMSEILTKIMQRSF